MLVCVLFVVIGAGAGLVRGLIWRVDFAIGWGLAGYEWMDGWKGMTTRRVDGMDGWGVDCVA